MWFPVAVRHVWKLLYSILCIYSCFIKCRMVCRACPAPPVMTVVYVQLSTLRGSILEDCIPSTSKLSTSRGLMPKDVLDYVVPGLSVSCLRHAIVDEKANDQLLRLDEQAVSPFCCSFSSCQSRCYRSNLWSASVLISKSVVNVRYVTGLLCSCSTGLILDTFPVI